MPCRYSRYREGNLSMSCLWSLWLRAISALSRLADLPACLSFSLLLFCAPFPSMSPCLVVPASLKACGIVRHRSCRVSFLSKLCLPKSIDEYLILLVVKRHEKESINSRLPLWLFPQCNLLGAHLCQVCLHSSLVAVLSNQNTSPGRKNRSMTMTETSGITRISQYSERICHCLLPLLPLPQNQVGKAADLVAVDLGSIEAPSTQLSSYIFRWLFRHISTISMYSNDFDIFRLYAV